MLTCKNCGAPMVQLFMSWACKDECDLKGTPPKQVSGSWDWAVQQLRAGHTVMPIGNSDVPAYRAADGVLWFTISFAPIRWVSVGDFEEQVRRVGVALQAGLYTPEVTKSEWSITTAYD